MTDSSRLFGAQKEALRDALMSAFYNRDELDQLLTFRLNRSLDEVAGPGNLKAVTLAVIKAAEGEGWTDALIRKAHEYRPNNPSLQGFFAAYVGSTQRDVDRALGDSGAELERTIEALNAFQDVRAWRERLCEIEARVCRIDHGGPDKPQGTGFLVAARLRVPEEPERLRAEVAPLVDDLREVSPEGQVDEGGELPRVREGHAQRVEELSVEVCHPRSPPGQ